MNLHPKRFAQFCKIGTFKDEQGPIGADLLKTYFYLLDPYTQFERVRTNQDSLLKAKDGEKIIEKLSVGINTLKKLKYQKTKLRKLPKVDESIDGLFEWMKQNSKSTRLITKIKNERNSDKNKNRYLLTRYEICKLVKQEIFHDNPVFLAYCILTWGNFGLGTSIDSLKTFLISYKKWENGFRKIRDNLREKKLSPVNAYEKFYGLDNDGLIPGGPSVLYKTHLFFI